MITDYGAKRALAEITAGPLRLSLHAGNPGDTGANEIHGGQYKRAPIMFGAVHGRMTESTSLIEFEELPECTLTHYGVWDKGGLLAILPLTESKFIPKGAAYRVRPGTLDLTQPKEE